MFTGLNYRGAKVTGSIQNIVVVILVLFIGAGLPNVDAELQQPFAPEGWGAVVGIIGLIIVSFTGFEKISTVAEEIKRPDRNLPLAIVGSVIIATIIYGLILFVMTGIFSYSELGHLEAPLVEAAAQIARGDDAELTILRIVRPDDDLDVEAEMRGLRHLADEVLGGPDPRVQTRIQMHKAVVEGILEEAQSGEYDLLVIGASNEWAVKSLLVGAVPDAIADRAPCSVLMVRRYEPSGISTIRRVARSVRGW